MTHSEEQEEYQETTRRIARSIKHKEKNNIEKERKHNTDDEEYIQEKEEVQCE